MATRPGMTGATSGMATRPTFSLRGVASRLRRGSGRKSFLTVPPPSSTARGLSTAAAALEARFAFASGGLRGDQSGLGTFAARGIDTRLVLAKASGWGVLGLSLKLEVAPGLTLCLA